MTSSSRTKPGVVYIPGLSDHFQTMAAALRAYDQPAEVLAPTTPATLAHGMEVCKGRECMFCIMIVGDLLARARQPDFDPEQAALFLPTFTTKCVYVNYQSLQQDILADQGLGAMEFLSPHPSNGYRGLGSHPDLVRSLIWHGFVAVDLLIRLLYQHRPYEVQAGQSDQAYDRSLKRVISAVESGDGDSVIEAMRWSAEQFAGVRLDRSTHRPRIGVLGDFYMLYNPYLLLNVARQIEALGGEVEVVRFIKTFYFLNWFRKDKAQATDDRPGYFQVVLEDAYQRQVEQQLVATVQHLLTDAHPHEPPGDVLVNDIKSYYHPHIVNGGFSMGTAIDMARNGCAGLLHIVPFLCVGSIIAAAMGSRIRADIGGIPWLDVVFDAQGDTNVRTRLEAFMYQAGQFQRTRAGDVQHVLSFNTRKALSIPLSPQLAGIRE